MKTWMNAALGVSALLWLSGCSGIPVDTDYDPDYHLSPTANYAWMEAPPKHEARDPIVENDLLERRVRRAVDEQLAANGLRLVAPGQQADVLVTYHAGEKEKVDIDTTDNFYGYYGYYPCWHCWGPRPYDRDIWVNYYTQGTLVVDMVDAKTKQLIWRGVANRRIPNFKTPQERDAFVRESVSAIFKRFPPGTKRD